MLIVIDEFTRRYPAVVVDRRLNGIVTLLNGRAANWLGTQTHAIAVMVCHRPIASM